MNPTRQDIVSASGELAAGTLKPSDLLDAHIARIEKLEPGLNAYIRLTLDQARQSAKAADGRRSRAAPLSPLDGIPIALKDNIDLAGVETTNGMAFGEVPAVDADVVATLKAAGAVILGKLNLHEGALGATTDNPHHGRTHNPWRTGFTPGGSSGGSGAGVAAGLCLAALGTDTMGSVRLPAAYNGVVGLIPTRGMLSMRGVVPLSRRLDNVGPLCGSVRDAALLLEILAGHSLGGAMISPAGTGEDTGTSQAGGLAGLRVGLLTNFEAVPCDADVGAAFAVAVEKLRGAGADIETMSVLGYDADQARRAGFLVSEADGAAEHATWMTERPDAFSPAFFRMLCYGRDAPEARLKAALELIENAGRAFRSLLGTDGRVDLIVSPTAPQTAFPFDAKTPSSQADFTALASFAGCPAISVPCGVTPAGLPVGLQLIAAPSDEGRLLSAAMAFERRVTIPAPPLS